jgi:hypothetical protein
MARQPFLYGWAGDDGMTVRPGQSWPSCKLPSWIFGMDHKIRKTIATSTLQIGSRSFNAAKGFGQNFGVGQ